MFYKINFSLSILTIALILSTKAVYAGPTPKANLKVTHVAPVTTQIKTPTNYTVMVENLGPQTASNVVVTVDFPLTNTSPTTSILGTATKIGTNCALANKKITCTFSQIKKGNVANVQYTYTAPVSSKTLTLQAAVTSSTQDPITSNNTSSVVPSLAYPTRPITSANIVNSHCTGRNLTSYFECELYPSSISSHTATLNSDHTITLTEPGYTGTWSQSTSTSQLKLEYFDTNGKVMEFNGFATQNTICFEGITNFYPPSEYMSAYKVCIQ